MVKIYHNSKCRKSREGLAYLTDKTKDIEIIEYLKVEFTQTTLKKVINQLGIKPEKLVRKEEDIYKKELKGKTLSDEEWIKIMVENPRLIQRPIVVNNNKAIIARPANEIDKII